MISFGHLVLMRYGGTKQNCILWYPVRLYRRWINKVHAQIHKKRSNMIWYNRRWMCREVFSHISPPRFSQVFLVLMSSSLLSKTSNKTENDEWSLKVLEQGLCVVSRRRAVLLTFFPLSNSKQFSLHDTWWIGKWAATAN